MQAWKSADLTTEQRKMTQWHLLLARNISENELRTAIIRNQGELLANPAPVLDLTKYEIRFKNDIRPDQTLNIDLWNCKSSFHIYDCWHSSGAQIVTFLIWNRHFFQDSEN